MNSPFDFGKENVEKAIQMIDTVAHANLPLVVVVDADADGFTSAAIFLNYIYDLYLREGYSKEEVIPNLKYILHDGKQHGLEDTVNKILEDEDIKFVVIPDAGTNDIEQMQRIIDAGKFILCMDHHESDN